MSKDKDTNKIYDENGKYYFPKELKKRLDRISQYPVTVVEAPSGFGKTTAIKEYLSEDFHGSIQKYWYTCLGEPMFETWMGICDLFSNIDAKAADDLKSLKEPAMDTLFYMRQYLRSIHCYAETYLVVDNFQLADCAIPSELINTFSMHGNPNLHIIFIAQKLEPEKLMSVYNNNIYTISTSFFLFDKKGIISLYRMEGTHITDSEAQEVLTSTEGWVAAVRLQMLGFMKNGSFTFTSDLERLVESAVWNYLTPIEKKFLLSVSILDSFTERQAAIMLGMNTLPESMHMFLKNNYFIRYFPDKSLFCIYSILKRYLRRQFYSRMPEDYQNSMLCKAGNSCAAMSQYRTAATLYYKAGDFDAIFSLPFNRKYLDCRIDKRQPGYIAKLINDCPENTLCKYPYSLLILGYYTLACGQLDLYEKLFQLLRETIQKESGFSKEELMKIKCEYKLLASMMEFNSISKMYEVQKEAWAISGEQSKIFKHGMPWFFASASVLNMFWQESGELENELRQLDEYSTLYYKLTNAHGEGSCILMRAEAMLMRGDDEQAEILCHKALCAASSCKQVTVCISIELLFGRIAVLRGDVDGFFKAVKNIQAYVEGDFDLYVLRMAEHCLSVLSLNLGIKDYVAPWLYDMKSISEAVYAPIVPYAQALHLKLLLMDKRYNEFYGIYQYTLDISKKYTGNIKYMMLKVYRLLLLSAAERDNGKYAQAAQYIKEALAIALPDKIYLPLARQEWVQEFLHEIKKTSQDFNFSDLEKLCIRWHKGANLIRKAFEKFESPLAPREREIALLARERLSSKEIADKLYISEMTVRTTLRTVYKKLNIHSRAELRCVEF